MLLYIAGPYRGDIEGNCRRAREVAIAVWRKGHVALCPHMNTYRFEIDAGLPEERFLDGDLLLLGRCDGVVFVPGWQESEGARAEREYAALLKLPMWEYPTIPEGMTTMRNLAPGKL